MKLTLLLRVPDELKMDENTKAWRLDLMKKLGSFTKIVRVLSSVVLLTYVYAHSCYAFIYKRCWLEEMMLKENATAAVAYKDLVKAKDDIVKAFKSLETVAKEHKSDASQLANAGYKAAFQKVQRLVRFIQHSFLQHQSANTHARS